MDHNAILEQILANSSQHTPAGEQLPGAEAGAGAASAEGLGALFKHRKGATPYPPTEALRLDDFLRSHPGAPNGKTLGGPPPTAARPPVAPYRLEPGQIHDLEGYAERLLHGGRQRTRLTTRIGPSPLRPADGQQQGGGQESSEAVPPPAAEAAPAAAQAAAPKDAAAAAAGGSSDKPGAKRPRRLLVDEMELGKFARVESQLAAIFGSEA